MAAKQVLPRSLRRAFYFFIMDPQFGRNGVCTHDHSVFGLRHWAGRPSAMTHPPHQHGQVAGGRAGLGWVGQGRGLRHRTGLGGQGRRLGRVRQGRVGQVGDWAGSFTEIQRTNSAEPRAGSGLGRSGWAGLGRFGPVTTNNIRTSRPDRKTLLISAAFKRYFSVA